MGSEIICKNCSSDNIIKYGKLGDIQLYRCKDCHTKNHKGMWCIRQSSVYCLEGFCDDCSIPANNEPAMIMDKCRKWETCHKKDMVLDKDYDYKSQYLIVMRSVCKLCVENGENV
jgi:hypothetical protein